MRLGGCQSAALNACIHDAASWLPLLQKVQRLVAKRVQGCCEPIKAFNRTTDEWVDGEVVELVVDCGGAANLEGYALCRWPPHLGKGVCGGGYVRLALLPCWVCWLLVVLKVLVFL